jgi:hypothetical protein
MSACNATKAEEFGHTPETGSRTTGKTGPKGKFASNVTFRALFKKISEGGKL